jgi:hypothetical protein
MNRRTWAAALLALTVAATGTAQAAEGSQGILYKVSGGQAAMYLLGSIHVGSADMYPFGDAIQAAMAEADTFVYECDMTSAEALATVRARMQLPKGQTLADAIGQALHARVVAVCARVGLDARLLDTLTPWAVINTLAVYATAAELGATNAEQALSLGVEKQVMLFGENHQRRTVYLETVDEQLSVLEGFSPALVTYLLTQECDVIERPETARGLDATIGSWPAWWRAGEADAFARQYLDAYLEAGYEAEGAEYHRVLVSERNARMARRLDALLREGSPCFVTLGLLHLILPEDSIVTALRDMGYTVERIVTQ